ncbi:hypothetical protein M8J75_005915 [Diaphorina citri]|nr:hypothetical protein M8J75_005915 [Diaphorina citri]
MFLRLQLKSQFSNNKLKWTTRIRIHKTRNTLQDYPTQSSYQNTEPNASSSPGSSSISEKNVAGAIRIPGPKSISYGSSGPSSISETSTPEASRIPGPNSISKSGSISEETPVPRKIPGPKSISNRSPGPKSSKRISGPKSISNPSSVPSTEDGANVDAVVSKDVAKSPDLNNPKRRRGRSSKNITKPSPSSSPSLSTNPSSPQSSVSSPLPISPVISPPLKQEPSPLKTEQPKANKPKSRLPSTPTSKNKLPQSLSENVPSDTELKTELPQTPVPSSPTTNKSGLPASKTTLPRSKPAKKKLPKIPKRAMKLTEMLTAYVSSLPSIPSILKSNLQPGSTSTSKPPPSPRTRLPDESKLPTGSIGKSTLPSVSTDANKLVATSTDGSKPPLQISTGRKAKVLGTPVVENKVPSCKTESSGSILILPICTKIIEGKPLNTSFEIKLTPIADKSKVPANSADKLLPKSTNKSKPPPSVPVDTDKLLSKSTNKSKPPPTVPVDLNQSISIHPAWMDASIQKRKNLFLKVLRTYAQQYHSPSNDNHFYRYYLEELMNQFQLPELRRLYIKTKMKLLKKSLNQELLDTFPPLPSPSLMAGDEKSNASSSGGCSGLEREDPRSNPKDGEKEGNLTNPLKRPFNNELVISEAFKRARLAFSFYQKSNENNDTKTKETSDIQMDMVSSTCKFAEEFILPDDITPEFPTRVSPPRDEPRPVLPDNTIEDNDLICISDDDDEVMVLSEDEKTNVVQKVEKEDEEIKVVDAKLTNHWTVRSHHDAIIPVVSIYEVPVPWVLGEPKCFKYDSERDTEPEPMGDSVLVKLPSALSLDGSEVTPSTAQNSPVPTYSVIPINNPLTKGLNMVMPLENTTAVPAEITSPKPVKNSSPVKEVKNLIDKITSISQRGKCRPILPRPAATSVKSPLLSKHLNTKGDTVRTTNELTASSKTEANTIVRTSKEQLTTGSSNTGQNSSNNQSARNSSEDYVTTLRRKIEAITTSNPKAAKKARPKKAANVSSSRNENTNAESNRTGPSTSDPIQISSDVSLRPLVGKPNGGSLDLMPSAADSKSEPQTNIISNSELEIKISSVFSMAQQRSEMISPKSATLNRVLGTIAELEKPIQTSSVSSGSTGSTIKSSSVSSDSTERTIKSSSVSSDSTGKTKSSSVSSDSTGRTTKSSSVSSDSTGRTIKSSSVSSDSTGRTIKSSSVSSDSTGRTIKSSSVSSDSTGRTIKSSSVSSDSTGRTTKSSSVSSDSTGRTIKSSSVSSDSTGRTIKSSLVSSDSTGRTIKSSSVSSAAPVIMISDDEDEDLIVLS